jgi:hypothetical protein
MLAPTVRGGSAVIDERAYQMRTASAKLITSRAPPDA